MLDNYQDQFRILRGTNTTSNAEVAQWNLTTRQVRFTAYTGSGAFPGTAVANLGVDSSGNILTVGTVTSASYALNATSASYSLSGSYALNATTAQTASYVLNAVSA